MSDQTPGVTVGPLLVIGGGAMATAILSGAAAANVLDGPVVVAEPDHERRAAIAALAPTIAGVASVAHALDALPYDDASVLLCVKPQALGAVAGEVDRALGERMLEGRCLLSIVAGATTESLAHRFRARVVRLMPNLPIALGLGATAVCAGEGATGEDLDRAHRLFGAAGRVFDLPEAALDAFTAVAGSGPAYAFLLAEALAQGALEAAAGAGPGETALRRIIAQTLLGAAAMLADGADGQPPDPALLRQRVTSRGGTTEAALAVLERNNFRGAVRQAVLAAAQRAGELGGTGPQAPPP